MNDFKKITIESYNKTAKEYDETVADFDALPSLEEFTDLIKSGGYILDLGCGPGQHSKIFVERGFKVIGIDLSREMVRIAKLKVPQATFKIMDISELKLGSAIFDGIWASASLIHIPKQDLLSVITKLKNHLSENGTLYISFKKGKGEEVFVDMRYAGNEKFYAYYSLKELKLIIKDAGFRVIRSNITEKRLKYDTNSWIHLFCKK